jgi:hypothetical protein
MVAKPNPVVNLRLLSHPINWLFVWAVLALGLIAYKVVHDAIMSASAAATSIAPD